MLYMQLSGKAVTEVLPGAQLLVENAWSFGALNFGRASGGRTETKGDKGRES